MHLWCALVRPSCRLMCPPPLPSELHIICMCRPGELCACKPKFHLVCHVTIRHAHTLFSPCIFGTWKSCVLLCRACRAARCDRRVTTSTIRTSRARLAWHVQGRRHSVNWRTCSPYFFQKLFLRLIQILKTHKINLYTRALLFLRRPQCWTSMAQHARSIVFVSCCKWNLGYTCCRH